MGHLVAAPFGPRILPGVVTGEAKDDAGIELRPIHSLLDPVPVVSIDRIELARWISGYYCCPLSEAIRLFLPPGTRTRTAGWFVKSNSSTQQSDPELSKALDALPGDHTVSRARVIRALDDLNLRSRPTQVLNKLIGRGMLREVWAPASRRVASTGLTLRYSGADDARTLPKNATRLRRAVDWLRARKPASGPLSVPLSMAAKSAGVSTGVLRRLAQLGVVEIVDEPITGEPVRAAPRAEPLPPLTPAQDAIHQELCRRIGEAGSRPALIHGVTSSGKTEIYLRLVADALRLGQSAIILVPEIALTPQTIGRFERRFPGRTAALHSQLSDRERSRLWDKVAGDETSIVIGARSAIFAPVRRLGLIILDEEHEASYKQEVMPRYHVRDVAIKLSGLSNALLVLGSATPDLQTYSRSLAGQIDLFELAERISVRQQPSPANLPVIRRHTQMPSVEVVDLRAELKSGNRSIFSRRLIDSIRHTLALNEQIILFLNRRGSSTFVICRECSLVMACQRCDVSLVHHRDLTQLVCHLCGRTKPIPGVCPDCGSTRIRYFGAGTQRVEEETRRLFPDARVVRWDRDSARRRESHQTILQTFVERRADVMVGTQMIAKGLDLPAVTLVGIVSADITLHLPDFRAAERTFQLMTQVAGRAGRGESPGRTILQTYTPSHYAILAASHHDYQTFYRTEMPFRQQRRYPPAAQLARLLYASAGERRSAEHAERLAAGLRERLKSKAIEDLELLGPAPAYHHRVRGKYRWQIILRGPQPQRLLSDLPLPPGWVIDIDPATTL